jgi:DNA polymerase I-like protein with 3'-5' exonuclease and polymerase domains
VLDQFFRTWTGLARLHDQCRRRAKEGAGTEQTVFGRLVQARPSKKAVEITDWNRFTALTNYRVSGSAADLLKDRYGSDFGGDAKGLPPRGYRPR